MDVVLLNDGSHDLEPVRAAICEDALRLIAIESTSSALTALRDLGARVFIVAVSSMTDERVELARCIREQSGFTGNSILLCKGRQAEDAFHLCRAGVFQDYVSIDPLYDVYRLRLAVCRAMDEGTNDRELSALGRDLGEVRLATSGVSADLGDGIARVVELIREALGSGLPAGSNAGEWQPLDAADPASILEALALRDRQARLLGNIDLRLRSLESAVRTAIDPDEDTILLIDDDPLVYEVMADAVETLGFTLVWTMNATEAAARARSLRPKAVLLDVVMPGMSGLDVLRNIRQDDQVGSVPVIMLTGKQDEETVITARDLGVDGYLVKPPNRADLLAKLGALTQTA